jgi:hypothetical protein
MRLVLVLVLEKFSAEATPELEVRLLKIANVWLQRRQAGESDAMMVIGAGYTSSQELQGTLNKFGLGGVAAKAILAEGDGVGQRIGSIVADWLLANHPQAVSLPSPKFATAGLQYPPGGWWWVGADTDAERSELEVIREIEILIPDGLRQKFPTILTTLLNERDLWLFESDSEDYEVLISALVLAQWLNGFDAALGNNFFDFDLSACIGTYPLDKVRLGLEAAKYHENYIVFDVGGDESSNEEVAAACLSCCLEARRLPLVEALTLAFGGQQALFFALLQSVRSDFSRPVDITYSDVGDWSDVYYSECGRAWRFVEEGWCDFSDS